MSDVHDWMRFEARQAEQHTDGYGFDDSRPSRAELAFDEQDDPSFVLPTSPEVEAALATVTGENGCR